MMKMMKTGIGMVFLVYIMQAGLAQDNYVLLKQIEEAYQTTDYLYFKVDYAYYESLDAKQAAHTLNINSHRKGQQYYVQMEGYELFGDGKVHLSIDHEGQRIILLEGKYEIPGIGIAAFKEMAASAGLKLAHFEVGAGEKGLLFSAPEASATTIKLIYDASNYRLLSSQLKVAIDDPSYRNEFNNTRMEAKYSDYRLSKSAFPYKLSQFVLKQSEGQYTGTGKYKTYQVENLVK